MLYTVVAIDDIFAKQSNIIYEEVKGASGFFSTNPYDYLDII